MSTPAGNLRRRLQIQTRTTSQDASGAQVRTWSNYLLVWADIEPVSAAQKFYAGGEQADVTHTITVRWRSELADPLTVAAMRGVYTPGSGPARYFTFKAPREEGEKHRWLEIDATEGLVSA
jgi:SPP1 family predicted phage head-tail adaptor